MEDYFNGFWGILLLLTAFAVYFLPSILAKKESPQWAIFFVNLFLGWTLLGWLVALIWGLSYSDTPRQKTIINNQPEPDKYDKLARLKQLLDSGAISEAEYNVEKQKILSGLNTEWNIKN